MKRLVSVQAAMILLAAPVLAQGIGPPAPTGAPPSLADRRTTPPGPPITIDPRGLNGGVTGDIPAGIGAVVIDTNGAVHPLGTASDAVVVSPTGTDAAVRGAAPTTLNPAPPTAPLCRERRQPGCRDR